MEYNADMYDHGMKQAYVSTKSSYTIYILLIYVLYVLQVSTVRAQAEIVSVLLPLLTTKGKP